MSKHTDKHSRRAAAKRANNQPCRHFVSKDDFTQACADAVKNGAFKRSFMFYLKGKTKKSDKRLSNDAPSSLCLYNLVVKAEDMELTLRLDHALALLKLEGCNCDSTGEEVLGACYRERRNNGTPEWRVCYHVGEDNNVKETDLGTVDHVLARANGGEDRLYNMQLMRCGANWNKANDERDVYWDFKESRRVLDMACRGLKEMNTSDEKSASVKNELTDLFAVELDALTSAENSEF